MSLGSVNRLLRLVRSQPLSCSVRLYGRWMHRKPSKVMLPFEPISNTNLKKEKVIDLEPAVINNSTEKSPRANEQKEKEVHSAGAKFSSEKVNEIRKKKDEVLKKRKFYLSQQKVFNDNSEIIYEKLKENDGRIR